MFLYLLHVAWRYLHLVFANKLEAKPDSSQQVFLYDIRPQRQHLDPTTPTEHTTRSYYDTWAGYYSNGGLSQLRLLGTPCFDVLKETRKFNFLVLVNIPWVKGFRTRGKNLYLRQKDLVRPIIRTAQI